VNEAVQGELTGLRDAVENARSMPMSASAVINRQEVLDMIGRLSAAIDEASSESDAVVTQRDAVLAGGHEEAGEVVRQAELERDRLVSDSEVFRVAQREADQVLAAAKSEADELRRETDTYVEQRFANFEIALEKTMSEVRRGRATLAGRSAFDENNDSDEHPGELPRHLQR
jgi:hypothetical protein